MKSFYTLALNSSVANLSIFCYPDFRNGVGEVNRFPNFRLAFFWIFYLTIIKYRAWYFSCVVFGAAVEVTGYALRCEIMRDELDLPPAGYALWLFMVRYVSPVLIMVVFLHALGWLLFDPVAQWYWIAGAIGLLAIGGEMLRPRVMPVLAGR